MATDIKPFFIIGSQRSGTTLLRLILNAHPEIAIPEEGTFWMPLIRSLKGRYHEPIHPKTLNNYLRYIEKNDQFKAWFMQGFSLSRLPADQRPVTLQVLMNALYEEFARIHSKKIWGDKTPSFFRMVRELSTIFPGARFINIIRDGRDVYLSVRDREPGRKNIAVAGLEWKYKVEKAAETLSALPPEQVFQLRFEDLLMDPEQKVSQICAFLGVSFEKSMLEFYKTSHKFIGKHHSRYIFEPINIEPSNKWKRKLSERENKIFQCVAYGCLSKCGYEVASREGFTVKDKLRTGILLSGTLRRAFQVVSTALILHVSSSLGFGTSAAGGKRYYNEEN
jgi:hypothetical protein